MGAAALTSRARRGAAVGALAGLATLATLRLLLIHVNMADILYWEEPYRLTIAMELLGRPHLPLTEYQADHYQGGSLAVGVLAMPFVALFGPSFETLKLVPLMFTLATAILWCVLLWRAIGPRAAACDAWLFALAPPMAQIYQVHALGSHAESALFTAAGFVLVHEIAAGAVSPLLPFLLGLIGGLGIWFCYSAATGVAAWGLFWLAATPRGSVQRGWMPLAAGGIVGFSPWVAYNLSHGFRGIDRLVELLDASRPVVTGSDEPFLTRAAALFAVDLPSSLGFPEAIPGVPSGAAWTYLALITLALLVVGIIGARPTWRARAERLPATSPSGEATVAMLVLTALAFHLLAYTITSFRLDVENGFIAYRFFSPLFPLFAAALAVTFAKLLEWRCPALAAALLAVLVGLGGYGSAWLLREHPAARRQPIEQGYRVLGLLNQIKYRDQPSHAVAVLSRFSGEPRKLGFFGYGWGLQFDYEKYGDWTQFARDLALCEDPADRADALLGVRWGTTERLKASRDFANSGFRADYHQRMFVRLSEFAARLWSLPKDAS